MKPATIGILGFGYLGKELARLNGWSADSWVTAKDRSDRDHSRFGLQTVQFDWRREETWENLPDKSCVLVLTIPPILNDLEKENDRVRNWCLWIAKNRTGFKKLIYISSTGVYPNRPNNWTEQDQFDTDTVKGGLRLVTENQLSESFQTVTVRAGAIYGRGRNIGERILRQKPVPGGQQPVHRIHVRDLARIVKAAVLSDNFPEVVNAVDLERETTDQVANWLIHQRFFPRTETTAISYSNQFQTRKFELSEPNRRISNQLLTQICKFEFEFPTYREGLKDAFAKGPSDH